MEDHNIPPEEEFEDDLIRSDDESSSDEEMEENSSEEEKEESSARKRVYIPGQELPKGTQLVPDESSYVMRHEFGLDSASCLSFDFIGWFLGLESREASSPPLEFLSRIFEI